MYQHEVQVRDQTISRERSHKCGNPQLYHHPLTILLIHPKATSKLILDLKVAKDILEKCNHIYFILI